MFASLLFSLITTLFPSEEASLVFAGDAMQHQGQLDAAYVSEGTYNYDGYFDAVAPYISEADYSVVNLETPVANAHLSGYPCFNAPIEYVDELSSAGFDLFLTANNHTLDRRDKGLCQTIARLDSRKLDHIGTYINIAARNKAIPMVRDINGFKVGFLNYTYGTNGISLSTDAVVDYIDRDRMAADIKKTRASGAELMCVCIHWGDEYKLLPNSYQKSLAEFLKNQGVELIIGSHPHVIQPAEIQKNPKTGQNVLLVYSLGNFISDMKTTDTRGGMMVKTTLKRDAHGKPYVADASYRLVFTIPPGGNAKNFRLIPVDSDADYAKAGGRAGQCRAFATSALSVLNKHNIAVPRHR